MDVNLVLTVVSMAISIIALALGAVAIFQGSMARRINELHQWMKHANSEIERISAQPHREYQPRPPGPRDLAPELAYATTAQAYDNQSGLAATPAALAPGATDHEAGRSRPPGGLGASPAFPSPFPSETVRQYLIDHLDRASQPVLTRDLLDAAEGHGISRSEAIDELLLLVSDRIIFTDRESFSPTSVGLDVRLSLGAQSLFQFLAARSWNTE